MPNDPGLSSDTCIFMEAVTGDGGIHSVHAPWWLSPDIKLVGPVSGPDNADAGQINPVTVAFHRKPATSNCIFPGDEAVTVEVWAANPSLAISPRLPLSSARVGFIGAILPLEGDSGSAQVDWDVPPTTPAGDPQTAGHKCLVARAYPSSGSPSANSFFLPGDQHVAQHNLCIVKSATNHFSFNVNSFGFTPAVQPPIQLLPHPNAKLRAVLDLAPSNFVRNMVSTQLQIFPGSPQLFTTALTGAFRFDLTNLHATGIADHSHPPLVPPIPPHANPSFEAKVVLDSRHVRPLTFLADLKGLPSNRACIFHLIQTSVTDQPEGGLTLVVIRT